MSDTTSCPSWEGCSAPLCPLDKSFGLALWFPFEPICVARAYRSAHWRRAQVKVARKAGDRDTCYTARMLRAIKRVRPETRGIEDAEDTLAEESWLREHGIMPSTSEKGGIADIGKASVGLRR